MSGVGMDSRACGVSRLFIALKVPQQRSSQGGGGRLHSAPPLSKYEIMSLETSEYTESRVHFTGLIEPVLGVHTNICGPLARYSDLRSV